MRQASRASEDRQCADGRRDRRRTPHPRGDVEDEPRGRLVTLARRPDAPLPADRLQHGREPRRDDDPGRGHGLEGRDMPDGLHVEQPLAEVERRRTAHLFPLGPQRFDAGVADERLGRRRDADHGQRRRRGRSRRGGLRRKPRRKAHLVGADRADGRPPFVGHLQGYGQIESPHLRRPDGPPLGLLGRGRIPPHLRRRAEQGSRDGRQGHHARRAVGRPAGALFRHGRDRLEQRRDDAGLHLQSADGHRLRRVDRFGHLRLRPRKRRDAKHLQAHQLQYRQTRQRSGGHGRLRQISRLVAR